jgi:hypothetical protein
VLEESLPVVVAGVQVLVAAGGFDRLDSRDRIAPKGSLMELYQLALGRNERRIRRIHACQ